MRGALDQLLELQKVLQAEYDRGAPFIMAPWLAPALF